MATTDPFALPAFILSIVGLVIAVIGAATGVVALVWQIVTRTRGAHRVVVKVTSGMNLVSATGTIGPYYQIDVRNRGAAAVQVLNWSIQLPDGNGLVSIPAAYPPQPELPYMLQAGSTVSFYVLASQIVKAAAGRDLTQAQGVAHLGTGQLVKGKKARSRSRLTRQVRNHKRSFPSSMNTIVGHRGFAGWDVSQDFCHKRSSLRSGRSRLGVERLRAENTDRSSPNAALDRNNVRARPVQTAASGGRFT